MKKIVLLICLCTGVCHSTQSTKGLDYEWELYKINYQKTYKHTFEELKRRLTWEDNRQYIQNHNIAADNGTYGYWLEINHLSDLTIEEVVQQRTGVIIPTITTSETTYTPQSTDNIPEAIDWRGMGYVTPVKDQGNCGSCWAFAATGAIEGQNKAVNGKLVSLSEQYLVDCSFLNNGCNGGSTQTAFSEMLRSGGGINTELSYAYTGKRGICRYPIHNIGATIKGYECLTPGDENELKITVALKGPVAVSIHISLNFQSYASGIMYDVNCNSNSTVNHAVLVVGYGTRNGEDYWIIKNSWGTGWGDNGYAHMARNKHNQCSIASHGVIPMAKPYESKLWNYRQALEMLYQRKTQRVLSQNRKHSKIKGFYGIQEVEQRMDMSLQEMKIKL